MKRRRTGWTKIAEDIKGVPGKTESFIEMEMYVLRGEYQ
jgi:hypothetical protein